MVKEPYITPDEASLLEHWRLVKKYRKGSLRITLKSDGTQFFLEPTPAKEGKVEYIINNKDESH